MAHLFPLRGEPQDSLPPFGSVQVELTIDEVNVIELALRSIRKKQSLPRIEGWSDDKAVQAGYLLADSASLVNETRRVAHAQWNEVVTLWIDSSDYALIVEVLNHWAEHLQLNTTVGISTVLGKLHELDLAFAIAGAMVEA